MNERIKQASMLTAIILVEFWVFYIISYVDGPFTQTVGFGLCAMATVVATALFMDNRITDEPENDEYMRGTRTYDILVGLFLIGAWLIYTAYYYGPPFFQDGDTMLLMLFGPLAALGIAFFFTEPECHTPECKMTKEFKQTIWLFFILWVEAWIFYLAAYFDGPFCRTLGFGACAWATAILTFMLGIYSIIASYEERTGEKVI